MQGSIAARREILAGFSGLLVSAEWQAFMAARLSGEEESVSSTFGYRAAGRR
jgi:hypothetical protein